MTRRLGLLVVLACGGAEPAPIVVAPPVTSAPTASALPSTTVSAAPVPPVASASGPIAGSDDAVARAIGPANAALDRSFASAPGKKFGPHTGPWVGMGGAVVVGDKTKGFTVKWGRHASAGFEFDAEVSVSADGTVRVVRATADFSPD